jgi:hyaluronate lyase
LEELDQLLSEAIEISVELKPGVAVNGPYILTTDPRLIMISNGPTTCTTGTASRRIATHRQRRCLASLGAMANISRRRFFELAGAGAAAAIVLPHPQIALADGLGSSGTSTSILLGNIVGSAAGTTQTNGAPVVQDKLVALYDAAKANLDAMIANPTTELFPGLSLGTSDTNLMSTYEKLYQIAIGTAMPLPTGTTVPTGLSGNTEAEDRVIDALSWLYDNYFSDQSKGYYGNWYNWEIAIPQYASGTLALLADRLAAYKPDMATSYVHTMDLYLRSGKDGDVDLDSRFDTGANLADMTTNRIVQGAVIGDSARITKAISDQMTVYHTIDPYNLEHGVTDGFYADGSYLQHGSVAYTGSYGVELLSAATETIGMLVGTEFATGTELMDQINDWLSGSFAPTIAYGWLTEIVKGRSVSRTTSGYSNTVQVIEPTVALSEYVTADTAKSLKSYIKYLQGISAMDIETSSFQSPANILQYSTIVSDTSIPASDLLPARATFAFNAMDRNVHRRPGYMFALSRSSTRISKYEYMSGENLMPWFQGDGMSYLYLDGDDQSQAYGADYFTVVSPYRLSGVTTPVEERKTIPELYGEQFYDNPAADFTSSSVKQNEYVYFPVGTDDYSGSTHLDDYAAAAWVQSDDAAYAAKQAGELPASFVAYANARATKSWFMLDDEIVVLLAGIGDQHGRDVLTTIDSRISAPDDAVTVTAAPRHGHRTTGAGMVRDPEWVLYTNGTRKTSVGYAFFDENEAEIQLADVQRSLRAIRQQNPDNTVSKTVFNLSVSHPARERPGSLAYAVVPSADEARLGRYRDRRGGGPVIIANSTRMQAIRHDRLGLLSANVFAPHGARVGPMTLDGPASMIARQEHLGRTTIAVSDPTFARDQVRIILPGHHEALGNHPDVTARPVRAGTVLTFDTHRLYGATVSVTVRGNAIG